MRNRWSGRNRRAPELVQGMMDAQLIAGRMRRRNLYRRPGCRSGAQRLAFSIWAAPARNP